MSDDPGHGDDTLLPSGYSRGQAEVIAVVVLLGFVIIAAVGVVAIGQTALAQLESQSRDEAATQSLEQAKVELASLEPGDSQTVEFSESIKKDIRVKPDAGTITVRMNGQPVYNSTLGAIIYESHGAHVAYQAGGVWEMRDGSSTMTSSPNFQIQTDNEGKSSLQLRVASLQGKEQSGRDLTVTANGIDETPFSQTSELPAGMVEIEIQSEYYQAWATYLKELDEASSRNRLDSITVDDSTRSVTAKLEVLPRYDIESGVSSPASGDIIDFNNNLNVTAYDSENPARRPKSEMRFGDNVDISSNVDIETDIVIDGKLTLSHSQANVLGDVYCVGETADCVIEDGGTHSGEAYTTNLDIRTPSAEPIIRSKQETISEDNDNANSSAIDGNRLTGDKVTKPGQYYLSSIEDGDKLHVDLENGGTVELFVDGDIHFSEDVEIDSEDEYKVHIYTTGNLNFSGVDVNYDSSLDWYEHDSTTFKLFANPGTNIHFENRNNVVGLVYAGHENGQTPSRVSFENNQHFYGGLIASIDYVQNNVDMYYDEALLNVDIFGEDVIGGGHQSTGDVYLKLVVDEITIEDN